MSALSYLVLMPMWTRVEHGHVVDALHTQPKEIGDDLGNISNHMCEKSETVLATQALNLP